MGPEGFPLPRPNAPARARVVIVEDARSIVTFNPVATVVQEMMDRGIQTLTGKESSGAAWRTFASAQDTVGIKVCASPGPPSGTRLVVVEAVIKGLLAAGLRPGQIIIWEKHLGDLRLAGYDRLVDQYGVSLAGSAEAGYDENHFYETALLGKLVWGDLEFGRKGEKVGRRSFVSKLLSQRLTKIINVTPLLNHNLAQVTGNVYGLASASVDNTIRFEAVSNPAALLGEAVPEIYALPEIGDRVSLNIVDGLICQYEGEDRTLLHYATMLGQLRLSTDAIALDVLSVHELDRQRQLAKLPPVRVSWNIYTNAAFLDLGVSDPRSIDVLKLNPVRREESSPDAAR